MSAWIARDGDVVVKLPRAEWQEIMRHLFGNIYGLNIESIRLLEALGSVGVEVD